MKYIAFLGVSVLLQKFNHTTLPKGASLSTPWNDVVSLKELVGLLLSVEFLRAMLFAKRDKAIVQKIVLWVEIIVMNAAFVCPTH